MMSIIENDFFTINFLYLVHEHIFTLWKVYNDNINQTYKKEKASDILNDLRVVKV